MLSSQSGKRFAAMWGSGDYGRLGLGNLESQWRPAVFSALSDHSISAVACGGAHSLFLTVDGEDTCGERIRVDSLDWEKAARVVHVPTKVQVLHVITIKSVALGSEHSVAVTDGGEVLSWGGGGSGRLGHGHESSFFWHLKK